MNGCPLPPVRIIVKRLAVQLGLAKRTLSFVSAVHMLMTIGLGTLLQLLLLLSSQSRVERIQSCSLVSLELQLGLILDYQLPLSGYPSDHIEASIEFVCNLSHLLLVCLLDAFEACDLNVKLVLNLICFGRGHLGANFGDLMILYNFPMQIFVLQT